MAVDVPRRLPPNQAQRIRNVARTHASLSGQGLTAAARPVQQAGAAPRLYAPPITTLLPVDRLTVTATLSSLSGSSTTVTSWATNDSAGTAVHLGSPDDGGIYIDVAGIYAVTVNLTQPAIHSVSVDSAIQALLYGDDLLVKPAAQLRGGDGTPLVVPSAVSSTTRYLPAGASMFVQLAYQNLDSAITDASVRAAVQRLG